MWGHPMPVLGALSPFLEPFCWHLLTFEIPPQRASGGEVSRGEKMLSSGTEPESYITEYTKGRNERLNVFDF